MYGAGVVLVVRGEIMIREEWRCLTFFTVILIIFSALVVGIGAAVASPSASINPTVTSDLVSGDVFQVTLDVNSDIYDLRSLNMYLYYDSSALQVNSISENGLLGSSMLTAPGSGDDGAGTILYGIASTAGTYSPKSGTFLTIQFQVKDITDSTYNLDLANVELLDGANTAISGVSVTDGRVEVGTAYVNPTVETDPQVNNDESIDSIDSIDSVDSNDIEAAITNDPETDDESSSVSTESADTTLKSVATTQSPDDSEDIPEEAAAGSPMLMIVIGAIIIAIAGYKLKEK